MASDRRRVVRRALLAALILAVLLFAVEGGEFGTSDLVRQRWERAALMRKNDSLQHLVDSLRRYEHLVETDPATQERIAREVFGMVRGDKEIVYRFVDSGVAVRR